MQGFFLLFSDQKNFFYCKKRSLPGLLYRQSNTPFGYRVDRSKHHI